MKKLYAPWRHGYITKNQELVEKHTTRNGCVFCLEFEDNDDEKHLILRRFNSMVVVMNHYPYNAGHLMVLPLAHKAELFNLTPDESLELMKIAITIRSKAKTIKNNIEETKNLLSLANSIEKRAKELTISNIP